MSAFSLIPGSPERLSRRFRTSDTALMSAFPRTALHGATAPPPCPPVPGGRPGAPGPAPAGGSAWSRRGLSKPGCGRPQRLRHRAGGAPPAPAPRAPRRAPPSRPSRPSRPGPRALHQQRGPLYLRRRQHRLAPLPRRQQEAPGAGRRQEAAGGSGRGGPRSSRGRPRRGRRAGAAECRTTLPREPCGRQGASRSHGPGGWQRGAVPGAGQATGRRRHGRRRCCGRLLPPSV